MEVINRNEQVWSDTYSMKQVELGDDLQLLDNYYQFEIKNKLENSQEQKLKEFKERLNQFGAIETLEEAKELSKKILPVNSEFTRFNIGGATCFIINNDDLFRVSLDSKDEFICFDFV